MSKLNLFITSLSMLILTLFSVAFVSTIIVSAGGPQSEAVCESIGGRPGAGGTCDEPADTVPVDNVIAFALNLLSIIAGIIAVVMVIVSGVKFMTSNGDPQSVAGARRTLLFAVVGIVVVALSQLIVRFVLARATA